MRGHAEWSVPAAGRRVIGQQDRRDNTDLRVLLHGIARIAFGVASDPVPAVAGIETENACRTVYPCQQAVSQ